VVGPTATGKTDLALKLAPSIRTEVVSIDSALVYRGMDIGTEKPTPQQLASVRHHMIDIADPSETLTVAEFQERARNAIEGILEKGATPLLVGGSGLYFRAVVDPLEFPPSDPAVRARLEEQRDGENLYDRLQRMDAAAASRIEPANLRRVVRALEVIELTGRLFSSFRTGWDEHLSIYDLEVVGLTWPRDELDLRINQRIDDQILRGLVEEVKELLEQGLRDSLTSVQAIGYRQIVDHLDGMVSLDEAVDQMKRRTRRYARRQLTWFRSDPRVRWFESDLEGAAEYLRSKV
jgi:tRNA dimethylallyltransferase